MESNTTNLESDISHRYQCIFCDSQNEGTSVDHWARDCQLPLSFVDKIRILREKEACLICFETTNPPHSSKSCRVKTGKKIFCRRCKKKGQPSDHHGSLHNHDNKRLQNIFHSSGQPTTSAKPTYGQSLLEAVEMLNKITIKSSEDNAKIDKIVSYSHNETGPQRISKHISQSRKVRRKEQNRLIDEKHLNRGSLTCDRYVFSNTREPLSIKQNLAPIDTSDTSFGILNI